MINNKKALFYGKIVAGTMVVAAIWCNGQVTGYQKGYNEGKEDSDKMWRARLVKADYAEYDRKNGEWKLKPMEEVLMIGTIMGKSPLAGYYPEPEVDAAEIKKQLKAKVKRS